MVNDSDQQVGSEFSTIIEQENLVASKPDLLAVAPECHRYLTNQKETGEN